MYTARHSVQDDSVNFVEEQLDGGKIECRYVRRAEDYFSLYLSSHTGCRHSCCFCHLTQMGETTFNPVTVEQYLEQAKVVLEFYSSRIANRKSAKRVNFNWMARGEALSNPHLIRHARFIVDRLQEMAEYAGLTKCNFNISTILPLGVPDLVDTFGGLPITFYYSLYSMEPEFRKKWLPKAVPAEKGLELLSRWSEQSAQDIVLHWAFIKGENDSDASVRKIVDAVHRQPFPFRFNAVRYNPFSSIQGRESDLPTIEKHVATLALAGGNTIGRLSKIVPRVGFDVQASCGMFAPKDRK